MANLAWGDVPAWIGALATVWAAWEVSRIANRDRQERIAEKRNAEVNCATQFMSALTEGVAFYQAAQKHRNGLLPGEERFVAAQYAQQLFANFQQLPLLTMLDGRDLSPLSPSLANLLHLCQNAARMGLDQMVRWTNTVPNERGNFFAKLAEVADSRVGLVIEVANQVHALVYGPDEAPPWQDDQGGHAA